MSIVGQDGTRAAETARVAVSRRAAIRTAVTAVVARLWREMVGFGLVGGVGVVCDVVMFNVVLEVFQGPRVVASLAGTGLGTVVAYVGNKFWVFRRREHRQSGAELLLFLVVSLVGMGITAVCVEFNDQVLGNHSVLSANLAQFIFGQGLGTVFRFWACHRWVFPESGEPGPAAGAVPGPVSDRVPEPESSFL